ncbi:MAG: transglutaminase family protein [Candidatus Heimdallarchaeota archaeon]
MNSNTPVRSWRIRHQETLTYRTRGGTPSIRIKFYTYPAYRQESRVIHAPSKCKLKKKGMNAFFSFQEIMGSRGRISLDREIQVTPSPSFTSLNRDWGRISTLEHSITRKYETPSEYWPLNSSMIQKTTELDWFRDDNLCSWIRSISRHIVTKITERTALPTRLGAIKALKTGTGDCDEFTDLFVTFARARGIPARRLTGFTVSQDSLIPHAWAEVFSPILGWIPIDLARNAIGRHSPEYIILKIEEFRAEIPDYRASAQHSSEVRFHWERPDPVAIPVI